MDSDTGVVSLRRPLNRTDPEFPANSIFSFRIVVSDQVPTNQKSGEASVSITVVEGGDAAPRFNLGVYSVDINENYGVGAVVVNTRAVDPDNDGQVA